jgi:hypothetical protein
MSLESEHTRQQMSTGASGMLSGDPPYVSQGADREPPYNSVLPRNVNQLDSTYSPLQRGSSGLSESPYNTVQRGGSGNLNEPSYVAVARRVSTASSPYSVVPRGASNSPYSDLSRASHDSPYTVSQEDGSPYSSRCSSTVGANSDTHLAVTNGVSIPNGHYSAVSGNRSVSQNDPYNFQFASSESYLKLADSGTYSGRQDPYAGSYQAVCKDVSNNGSYDVMYPNSHGCSDNPYSDTRSDPQYSGVEGGAPYSSIPSGGPLPCGNPYTRVPMEHKPSDMLYANVICGGSSGPYSRDGVRYSKSGSHDGSYGTRGTSSHDIAFSNSKSHIPSHNESRNSFNHNATMNVLYNPNSGHYCGAGSGAPIRASPNGAYSSACSSRNSQAPDGATLTNAMEVAANCSFKSGSHTEQAFHQSGRFAAGFEAVNCTAFQSDSCPRAEQMARGKDCRSTAEHFQASKRGEEGQPVSERGGCGGRPNSDGYASGECSRGLLAQRSEVMNPPAPSQTHSDDEIEDDFNWDRLL